MIAAAAAKAMKEKEMKIVMTTMRVAVATTRTIATITKTTRKRRDGPVVYPRQVTKQAEQGEDPNLSPLLPPLGHARHGGR